MGGSVAARPRGGGGRRIAPAHHICPEVLKARRKEDAQTQMEVCRCLRGDFEDEYREECGAQQTITKARRNESVTNFGLHQDRVTSSLPVRINYLRVWNVL